MRTLNLTVLRQSYVSADFSLQAAAEMVTVSLNAVTKYH